MRVKGFPGSNNSWDCCRGLQGRECPDETAVQKSIQFPPRLYEATERSEKCERLLQSAGKDDAFPETAVSGQCNDDTAGWSRHDQQRAERLSQPGT